MRLHRMEITAFGPFAGHEVVDFERLNRAGVFLLNGETGSGKTSVLDAICFALYGTGPTTAAKGGRKAQHSDHADPHIGPRVDVEFSAGGRRWHVSRTPAWREPSSRAASGWTERHATVLLRESVEGEWVERGYRPDDVGQQIHHAIGLDREQFTQVIMLPQGRFARFLQAGSKEREELLETLFGTDVYAGIQDELKARADHAKQQLRDADAEAQRTEELLERFRARLLAAVEELPARARDEVEGTPAASWAPREQTVDETGPSDGPAQWTDPTGETPSATGSEDDGRGPEDARDVTARWADLAGAGGALVDAVDRARQRAAEEFTVAQRRAAGFEAARERLDHFDSLTRRRGKLSEEHERAQNAARTLQEHDAAHQLQDVVQASHTATREETEAAQRVSGLRTELAPQSPSGRSDRQVLAEYAPLLDEQLAAKTFSASLRDTAVAAREAARRAVERAGALERDRADMERETRHLQQVEGAEQQLRERLEGERVALAEREHDLEQLRSDTRDEALVRERARSARAAVEASRDYEHARATAEQRGRDYERDETARREAARHVERLEALRFEHAASALAEELAPGAPCPVCGSTCHPEPATATPGDEVTVADLERARAARDAAQDTADASHATWQRAQHAAAEALGRGAEEDLDAVVERARRAAEEETELVARLERAERIARAVASGRETLAEVEERAASTSAEAASARIRVDAAAQHCDREREQLAQSLRGFSDAPRFLEHAEQLLEHLDAWESAHRAHEQAREHARLSTHALERAVSASPFDGAADVSRALLEPGEARELRTWWEAHERDAAALDAELATEEMRRAAALDGPEREELSDAALARAALARDDLDTLRDRLTRQLGGLHALVEDITATASQVPDQDARHRGIRERAGTLGGLADVATATSSENSLRMTLTSFVLAAKLEQVAAVASEHLSRMSSGRFTLVHTDQTRGGGKSGLGLEIDDSWTGVRRGTETLSGGESFFTSLALALALADVVRAEAGGRDIDTLFVDEGFGSLDEQTLEQVLETLDGLRRDGRVIGVVSHVSEMKQRIDTQLVVTKTPQGSHLGIEADPWSPA